MSKLRDGSNVDMEELREYVDAFKASSDRVRFMLYVVIVVTTLMAVAQHNVQEDSWPRSRLKFLYSQEEGGERLERLRSEYHQQFVANGIVTSSPIPGIWIDANDLGTVGGIALALLMIVLVMCVAREHENLYLALYRVRSLSRSRDHAHGSSPANFLYHALAMRQVLTSPPTLARWHPRMADHFGLVFFFPVVVYASIVWTNHQSAEKALRYGPDYGIDLRSVLQTHIAIGLVLLILATVAWTYSRAMGHRWRRAFERVNPSRKHAPQMTVREWLWPSRPPIDDFQKCLSRVRSSLVDTLEKRPLLTGTTSISLDTVSVMGESINAEGLTAVSADIVQKGTEAVRAWCTRHGNEFVELVSFQPRPNELDRDGRWFVAGTWTFHYKLPENEGVVVSEAGGDG